MTNGLTLRMYVEALLDTRALSAVTPSGSPAPSSSAGTQKSQPLHSASPSHQEDQHHHLPPPLLFIEVFISDFHAARMQASFEWILGLEPSLTHHINMTIHSVPSSSSSFTTLTSEQMEERRQHEEKGVAVLKQNQAMVRSMPELYRFLLMGGHQGFRSYLGVGSGEGYKVSTKAGYE